jgi:hypothetical protein
MDFIAKSAAFINKNKAFTGKIRQRGVSRRRKNKNRPEAAGAG